MEAENSNWDQAITEVRQVINDLHGPTVASKMTVAEIACLAAFEIMPTYPPDEEPALILLPVLRRDGEDGSEDDGKVALEPIAVTLHQASILNAYIVSAVSQLAREMEGGDE